MPVNPIAENVFGTIGTVCWCIQLIPQAWKSWKEKSTFGLSPWLMLIWASAALPLGVYNIAQNVNIPLILQPQLFGTLAAACWAQCLHYEYRLSIPRSIISFCGFLLSLAGLQVAFVYAVWHGLAENDNRPLEFFGVMTALLVFLGLMPQFYEIWKLKEVPGISTSFMVIDGMGGLFSALSLAFKESIDPLLAFSYISVIILDALVISLKLILNPIAARRRTQEASAAAANVAVASTDAEPERETPEVEPSVLRGPYSRPPPPSNREIEDGISLRRLEGLRSRAPEEAVGAIEH
ncbi:hypothetical protein CALCODRAFT_493632 [Calocera cornea HHB12733]|uniref:PQ-loop-domain-containing protein n=1 Tax=Calocera cornea HHB12733 TaxID=1353952 RepID=A0A165HMS3_9BASI|nr:hypothetical protein CALCODRAFT_493632 [Calocera cornea HHB12733]